MSDSERRRSRGFGGVYVAPGRRVAASPSSPAAIVPPSPSPNLPLSHPPPTTDSPDASTDDNWESLLADDVAVLTIAPRSAPPKTRTRAESPSRRSAPSLVDDSHSTGSYTRTLKLHSFPASWKSADIDSLLRRYPGTYRLKWLSDTSLLAIFKDEKTAKSAYAAILLDPLVAVEPHKEEAESEPREQRDTEPRPVMTDLVARRLISGALGISARRPASERKVEEAKVSEARNKKRTEASEKRRREDEINAAFAD